MYEDIWEKLYCEARKVQKGRVISPFIEAGGVAAALLTKKGSIYVGVCIDTASTLGMCAERNAVFQAYCQGYRKSDIEALAIVGDCSPLISPCGACRQVLMELLPQDCPVILANRESYEITTMKELLPRAFIGESLTCSNQDL